MTKWQKSTEEYSSTFNDTVTVIKNSMKNRNQHWLQHKHDDSPPEKIFELELLKATQKMLLWCSPFMTVGDPESLRALSTSHNKILRSSPPASNSDTFN